MDNQYKNNLQALWDELNQDDNAHEEANLQARLAQRAKQYAASQRQETTYADDEVYNVLMFRLGKERYAIDVVHVRGVRPITAITRVPGVPTFYRGVINVRGRIISVLDLRHFFNISGEKSDLPPELLLIETENLLLGILAHHIEEIAAIPRAEVEAQDMKYARGVTSERLVILDIETLFNDDRLIIGGKANQND